MPYIQDPASLIYVSHMKHPTWNSSVGFWNTEDIPPLSALLPISERLAIQQSSHNPNSSLKFRTHYILSVESGNAIYYVSLQFPIDKEFW